MKTNKKDCQAAQALIWNTPLNSVLPSFLESDSVIVSGLVSRQPMIFSKAEVESDATILSEISFGRMPSGYNGHVCQPGYRILPILSSISDVSLLGTLTDTPSVLISEIQADGTGIEAHIKALLYDLFSNGMLLLTTHPVWKNYKTDNLLTALQQALETTLRGIGVIASISTEDGYVIPELTTPAKQLVSELLDLAKEELDG